MNTSETLFFHPLLLTGISSIIIFKIWNWIQNLEFVFKKQILKFIKLSTNSTFNVHNPHGIKLLTGEQVGLIYLLRRKFRINRFPRPVLQLRSTYWNNYSLLSPLLKFLKTKQNLFWQNWQHRALVETFLFGLNGLNDEENALIIESTIEYIITTQMFIAPSQ